MDKKKTIDINQIPLARKLLYSLLPVVALLLVTEIGLRVIYFQSTATRSPLAAVVAFNYAKNLILLKVAQARVGNMDLPKNISEQLYGDEGRLLFDEFKSRYEENFADLVSEANKIETKLIVVYVPSEDFYSKDAIMKANREFYSSLCLKYGVGFIDLTNRFLEYPSDVVTLLPENGHLSRFGNKIVADEIGNYIELHLNNYQSDFHFSSRPRLLGDLKPNDNSVWEIAPEMPYRVIVNSQGLRMYNDISFPKEKQRILILGDSFTFGPYLDNHDTYPELLQKKYLNKEFINAGVAGYTITDEVSLFIERAKYVEPDITILQVLDNDLQDLFYYKRNQFDRKREVYKPTELETQFLNKLR
jgi:hypothetical protein